MEEIRICGVPETDEGSTPKPRAGFACGWLCGSGFLCPGGNVCN